MVGEKASGSFCMQLSNFKRLPITNWLRIKPLNFVSKTTFYVQLGERICEIIRVKYLKSDVFKRLHELLEDAYFKPSKRVALAIPEAFVLP